MAVIISVLIVVVGGASVWWYYADKKAQEAGTAARQDATTEKRDADYAVANEKCDALPSAEKATCVQAAKVKFNK